ncbi:hypothetical protein KIN20_018212 [Parelaphostrongylus tenuis]|uniref:Uncharacterized protein n=1 Tax=Parelaphostrongylus tenuis TaxID=148309 RepID=A0AAD5N0T9_PARTN|nr:hypothetical protein KIN20_010814 [Parelaphostrongylus tenuis]KAJ1359466.1 hypothetical protein KIN20_018212 [Parelaphostrongylus tenuis]
MGQRLASSLAIAFMSKVEAPTGATANEKMCTVFAFTEVDKIMPTALRRRRGIVLTKLLFRMEKLLQDLATELAHSAKTTMSHELHFPSHLTAI